MTRPTRDGNTSNSNSKTRDDIRPWPWWAQFAALLFVLTIAAFLIVLPVLVVRVLDTEYAFSSETDLWAAMIAILLGLTTMTVSGVFVFMTFRIDRGARLEAKKEAEKEAKKALNKYGKKFVDDLTNKLEDQFDFSKQKISDLYFSVKDDVSEVAEKTKKDVSEVAEKTKKDVSEVADTVKTDVSQLADTVKTDVSQLADRTVETVENQVKESDERIRETFDKGVREIGDLFESALKEALDDADGTPNDDGTEGSSEK